MTKQQKEFGWSVEAHRKRDDAIAAVCLPNSMIGGDATVSKSTVMLLLYRLNHHAEGDADCSPSQEKLAKEMGLDRKTVGRAVEAAVRNELLTVKLKKSKSNGLVCNHYSIRWGTLARLGIYREHPEMLLKESDHWAIVTQRPEERSDMDRRPMGHTDPTDGTLRPDRCDILTQHNSDGVVGSCKNKKPPQPSGPSAQRREGGGCVLNFRWGRRIEPSELFDAERIEELYQIAILQRVAQPTELDRLAFFALISYVRRQPRKPGEPDLRVGLLTQLLKGEIAHIATGSTNWRSRPENMDEDCARQMIERLDREDDVPEPSPKAETAEESLARQRAALQGGRR